MSNGTFNKETAFKPLTQIEKDEQERLKKQSREQRQKIREQVADLINDEKYKLIRAEIASQRKTIIDLLLTIDMNDPMRFQMQADANVLDSVFRKIESLAS